MFNFGNSKSIALPNSDFVKMCPEAINLIIFILFLTLIESVSSRGVTTLTAMDSRERTPSCFKCDLFL